MNIDLWLSLVPDIRARPGVALAVESLGRTSLQPRCPQVVLASVYGLAKAWPGPMGPPKPAGHAREYWRRPPASPVPTQRPRAALVRSPARRPGHASGPRRLPRCLRVARGDAPAGSPRSRLALRGPDPRAPQRSGRHASRRLLRTRAPGPDPRRRLRHLVARARGTVPARGPRARWGVPGPRPGPPLRRRGEHRRRGPGRAKFPLGRRDRPASVRPRLAAGRDRQRPIHFRKLRAGHGTGLLR